MNSMSTLRYEVDADGIATVTFDEPGSPVNTMCIAWQEDLQRLVAQIVQDAPSIKGIVLQSAKTSFFAGADLKGLMRGSEADAQQSFDWIQRMKKAFRTLETAGKPVVACLNGTALGGGMGIATIVERV